MHISTLTKSFTYLGGKFSVLPWLLPILDVPSTHFVDVFGGSAVVLLNREPSPIETYNDINGKVVNFFKVLRNSTDELIRALELTPHSRKEYDEAWFAEGDSDVEQARKFFIRTQQSIMAAGGQDKVKGWACALTESRCSISERTNKWLRAVPNLWEVAERLKRVQIECRDFRFVMKAYDSPGTHFYLDSPYDPTYRSSSRYEFEFAGQDFHDMAYWCRRAVGKVTISGYDTPFMRELLDGFRFNQGPQRKNGRSTKPAMECAWTNYDIRNQSESLN